MVIDESEILLGAAFAGALPYALAALADWSRRQVRSRLQGCTHQMGA